MLKAYLRSREEAHVVSDEATRIGVRIVAQGRPWCGWADQSHVQKPAAAGLARARLSGRSGPPEKGITLQ